MSKVNSIGSAFGLTPPQFAILQTLLIEPLKSKGANVWIFGSRARGDHHPTSDVDILFEFTADQTPPSGFLFSIKSDLEESRFPFTFDLVNIKDLADSYRNGVLQERKLV